MKQQGITLTELIITLAIISILGTNISASFSSFLEQSQVDSDKSQLLLMLQTTRQSAVNHITTAVLCPSEDSLNCVNNWKLPTMIFHDRNNNKRRDLSEEILHQFDSFNDAEIAIKYPKTQIRFNRNGMANFYNGTLRYCLNKSIIGIVISRIGRIRFARDLNNDNIPDINKSTPVSCD